MAEGAAAPEPAAPPRRWMAVGRSQDADSRAAGVAAAEHALAESGALTQPALPARPGGPTPRTPKIVFAFVGIAHDLPAVLAGINEVTGGAPLIGCTTHGEICGEGPADASVVVSMLGGDGFSVATSAATDVAGRQREAGVEVAKVIEQVAEMPYTTLVMLTDGLTRNQEEILRGAYSVLGASVPLFGGAAADGLQMTATYQLHGSDVLRDAVVVAAIASEAPMAVTVRHGWRMVGEPMIVTKCENGRVYTLNDEPAMDVYLRGLNAPPQAYTDPTVFRQFALPRPLGVQRRSGEEVRNVSTNVDMEGRSLGSGGEIPQGGLTWLMEGNEASILDAARQACSDAIAALDGNPAIGLLTFSCAAVRKVLGDDGIRREHEAIRAAAGAPFAGFYTLGEIARPYGIDGFHNQTHVVLALS